MTRTPDIPRLKNAAAAAESCASEASSACGVRTRSPYSAQVLRLRSQLTLSGTRAAVTVEDCPATAAPLCTVGSDRIRREGTAVMRPFAAVNTFARTASTMNAAPSKAELEMGTTNVLPFTFRPAWMPEVFHTTRRPTPEAKLPEPVAVTVPPSPGELLQD